MKFVKYNIPKQPRSKKHVAASSATTIRTMLVQSSSGSGTGGGSVTIENDFSIQEIDDIDYPIVT